MHSYVASAVAFAVLAYLGHCDASPPRLIHRAAKAPIMGGVNFPDPSIIRTTSGWHLFSTNAHIDGKWIHIQRALTTDWKNFTFRRGVDALPKLPSWVDATPRLWATDVVQLGDGSYIMYYAAAYRKRPRLHCLGYATARRITDPFVDSSSEPWICPTPVGGAIDVAGFTDERNGGARYIVYKVDGNALGHGGSCGNTVKPIVPTPILLQQVGEDGRSLVGSPHEVLSNVPSDGPYVEAPSLTFMNGKFVLFFSSQCYQTDGYDVQYSTADDIFGPYTRKGRLFGTGTAGMLAPGGLDIASNGDHAIWHGYVRTNNGPKVCRNFEKKADCQHRNYQKGRAAYVAVLKMDNDGEITAHL